MKFVLTFWFLIAKYFLSTSLRLFYSPLFALCYLMNKFEIMNRWDLFFFNRECGPFHLFHLSCFPGQRRTGWISSRNSQNNFGRNCIRPTSRNSSIHWHNYLVHKHSLLKSNARCHTFPLDWPVDYQHPTAVCPQWKCEGGAAPVVTTAWLLSRASS